MIFAFSTAATARSLFALIIMGNVPLALIGCVTALWIAGQPLSVASHDRLHHADRHRDAQRHPEDQPLHQPGAFTRAMPFGRELIVRGSLERLTPVLMTALSAGVALMPLMIDADAPGKEILHPVAVTIFGGLVSATLLDTLLTPTLFLRYGRKPLERLVAQARAEADKQSQERSCICNRSILNIGAQNAPFQSVFPPWPVCLGFLRRAFSLCP